MPSSLLCSPTLPLRSLGALFAAQFPLSAHKAKDSILCAAQGPPMLRWGRLGSFVLEDAFFFLLFVCFAVTGAKPEICSDLAQRSTHSDPRLALLMDLPLERTPRLADRTPTPGRQRHTRGRRDPFQNLAQSAARPWAVRARVAAGIFPTS